MAASAARTAYSLRYHVLGFVIEVQARARLDATAIANRLAGMADDRFPSVRAALPYLDDADDNARFAHGIDLRIKGLAPKNHSSATRWTNLSGRFKAAR